LCPKIAVTFFSTPDAYQRPSAYSCLSDTFCVDLSREINDPLGRCIEKKAPGATKKFVWDGDVPLHEWDGENLVTLVFNDSFVPAAKLTNSGSYSIISDYLGTPAEAYDADG
jgi:hypothetical protein